MCNVGKVVEEMLMLPNMLIKKKKTQTVTFMAE